MISANNDDDDWLKLDVAESIEEQPSPKPVQKPKPTELASLPLEVATPATMPGADPGDKIPAGNKTPESNKTPASLGTEPETRHTDSQNDDDEFRLEPLSPPSKLSRSAFEEDFPDVLPIESSPSLAARPSEIGAIPSSPRKAEPKKTAQPRARNESENQPVASGNSKRKPTSADSPPKPHSVGSLDELVLKEPALGDNFVVPQDEEFRFACKICGTLLYANKSRIGSKTRCPDCHSLFVVPKPIVKPIQKEFKLEEMPSVRFAPIDAENSKAPSHQDVNTREILDRAQLEVDRERDEFKDIESAFDTKRWLGLILGFLRDPWVVTAIVLLGLVSSAWLFSMAAVGSVIEASEKAAYVARVVIFVVFLLPVGGLICLCGLPVLVMAANRAPRVAEWPFSRLGEAIGECMMVIVTLVIASIPGGMLGSLTTSLGAPPLIAAGMVMFGIWALAPILLLSMINNSSVFEPYSKSVFASIKNDGDAWGAMYIQCGLVYALFFVFMAVASLDGVGGDIVCGFVLPFFAFFIFNQLGVLAGRISPTTGMGFEGDFSGD